MLKRLFIAAFVILIGFAPINAAVRKEPVRFRAEAGLTLSKVSNFGIGSMLPGMRLSGLTVIPFGRTGVGITTGLTLTNKGENSAFYLNDEVRNISTITDEERIALMYLQLPLEVSYRLVLNQNNRVHFATGPFLAMGIGNNGKKNYFQKVEGADTPFNRYEFGWGFNIAYDYSNFLLKLGGEFSLSDVMNNNSIFRQYLAEDLSARRHGLLYITLGYQF